MGKFNKGLVLGGLLGAGLMWLSATKKGKEVREQMINYASEVYEEVKTKVMASEGWEKLTKNEYYKIVEKIVDKYAVENDLADTIRDMVSKIVKSQWKKIETEKKKIK